MKNKLLRIYVFIFELFVFFSSLACVMLLFNELEGSWSKILSAIYFPIHVGSFWYMMNNSFRKNTKK